MKATVSFAAEDNSSSLSAYLVTRENKHLASHVVKQFESPSLIACSQSCLRNSWCTSTNFKKSAGLDDKATCELNKHEFHAINDDTNLIDQPGTIFSMFLKVSEKYKHRYILSENVRKLNCDVVDPSFKSSRE